MDAQQVKIAANWNFVADFPELSNNVIVRPHLLSTMAEALSSDAPVLFLEGEEGDGATTTLAQFCQAYPDQTFALFVKPASSVTYGLEYLRLALAEQFHYFYYGETLQKDLLSVSEFEDLRLKTLRKNRAKILYFVIDGLHQIPAEARAVLSQVFKELLPTGAPGCRFIVTGTQADLSPYIHGSVKSKHYRLLKLSFEECRQFLSDIAVSAVDCERIYQLCKGGSPGRIAVVRRLLQGGTPLSAILETDPTKYLEFVKLEFDVLASIDERELLLLAGIAHSKIVQSLSDLEATFDVPRNAIERLVEKCQFLRELPNHNVEFISETHRKYATKRLEHFSRAALEAQLTHLQKHPRSETSLRFLPAYLETLQRQDAILQLLSKEHYRDLLLSTESFSALKAQAEMGARSAAALERASEVFKFSLQRSIFASASRESGSSDQVRALVALGRSNAAMALANSEATKESRLALLSAFARRFSERNGTPDAELLAYIKRLIDEVDFALMGDAAMRIAADVLIFDPDAAIGIIESAVKGATAKVKDAAYAELSISASMAKLKHKTKIEDKARSRISDQALHQIAHSFELLAEKLDAAQTMVLLSKMPPAHQVHFLRSLVAIKRQDPRILDLVELGLDIIIRETEYTPRAKDLAALCAPFFGTIADIDRLKKLVTRFDSQLGLVGKAAQSRDLIVLQMRLAAAERQYDEGAARDRVTQAYYDVLNIKTPEAQMECLAIMLGTLSKLDQDGMLEAKDGFRALVKSDLNNLLTLVLKNTADHIGTVMPALKALAADDCEAALALAGRLNVLERRDVAYRTVAAVIVAQPYTERRLASLRDALERISNADHRSRATEDLLGSLDANLYKAGWIPRLETFRDYMVRGSQLNRWDTWMFKAADAASCAYSAELLEHRVTEAISRVASPLDEAKIHFRASEALAEKQPHLAQQHYDVGFGTIRALPFATARMSKLYELCLSLVGRSIAPLARANLLDDDKFTRHAALVDHLPGIIPRIRILNEFAERLWCAKRADLTNRVVNQQLRPLLEQAGAINSGISRTAIRIAFPSLVAAHIGLAVPLLQDLPDIDSDNALFDAATVKLRHLSGQEPEHQGKFDYSKVDAADISDVIELLQHARSDGTIFSLMRTLVEAINDRQNRTKFTTTQKADWSARLRSIVADKLPDPKNIQHMGYKIVSLAQVYALVEVAWSEWAELERQADSVENHADRSYIYTELATALPSKYAVSHRKRLLDKALDDASRIPSPIDRLSHLQGYAQSAHANDAVSSARECLKAAMKLSLEIEDQARVAQHRRELVDIADQIDAGFADELIQLVDDDPARAQLKAEAKHAAAVAKAKREMANARRVQDANPCDMNVLPMAAWKNLGALQAGRLEVKPIDVMTQFITMGADGTLEDAYPVLSWHLTNMERKYTHSKDIVTHLVPLCEAMLLTTELTRAILSMASGEGHDVREEATEDGILVRRRNREEAIAYIGKWIRENADDRIVYCDAYFSTKDIQLLRMCLAQAPQARIKVIASKAHLLKLKELAAESFENAWREQSDQDPPETEIIAPAFIDAPDKHVIHDRWILTSSTGLRLGTSFSALGMERLSEVSEMEPGQASLLRGQIDKYLGRQRMVDGARIQYSSFTL